MTKYITQIHFKSFGIQKYYSGITFNYLDYFIKSYDNKQINYKNTSLLIPTGRFKFKQFILKYN